MCARPGDSPREHGSDPVSDSPGPVPNWRADAAAGLLGLVAALPAVVWLRGFMVDDALISARYAAHIAAGHGHRFNPAAAISDGVTPLGWAYLLAPFARGAEPVLAAFRAAKWIGLLAWLLAAAVVGVAIGRIHTRSIRFVGLLLIATSAPLAAWCSAGMETGLVLGLATMAVAGRALRFEAVTVTAAGVAAALRPELILWAIALAACPPREPGAHGRLGKAWLRAMLAAMPAVLVATLRLALFHRAAPLALIAKPSDLKHGAYYALACMLLCGLPAALAFRRLPRWVRGLQAAIAAHLAAILIAGGDWMPLSRLMVPALPTVVLTASFLLAHAKPAWGLSRLALGLAGQLFVLFKVAPVAAQVEHHRMAVLRQLQPPLQKASAIATLDIGWVGAASPAAVLDLAGVTDPAVAVLPGGHTSKQIPSTLLSARGVDTLVLLLAKDAVLAEPWTHSRFARVVELRLARLSGMKRDYQVIATSQGKLRYVVLRRKR